MIQYAGSLFILGRACVTRGLWCEHCGTVLHTLEEQRLSHDCDAQSETGYKVLTSRFNNFYVAGPESRWYLFVNACQNPQRLAHF